MTGGISIRREAAISVVINGMLSAAFFLGVFGVRARPLGWGAPDHLAFDFLPQSIAVALMSALVPVLIARRRLGNLPGLQSVLICGVLFALAGGLLGGLVALGIVVAHVSPIGWTTALAIKMAYGGALGALVATLALRRLLSSACAV